MADEKKNKAAETSENKKDKKTEKTVASKKSDKPVKDSDKKSESKGKGVWKSIKKFFKDVRGECKKVVWPDAKTVIKSTGIVLACVAVLAVIIWLIDTGLSNGINALVGLADKSGEDAETTTEAVSQAARAIFGFIGI